MKRRRRVILSGLALAVAAGALAGCVLVKPESVHLSQPGGIGDLRLQLGLCDHKYTAEGPVPCVAGSGEGNEQLMLAFALPPGTSTPATITASGQEGVEPITYSRSEDVAERLREEEPQLPEGSPEWPPPGTEIVGYLSEVRDTKSGEDLEWTVDIPLGLPASGPFPGPFRVAVVAGVRGVTAEHPANRPYHCIEKGEGLEPRSWCGGYEEASIGISDLRIDAPGPVRALAGGRASFRFPLDFATSLSEPPSFELTATTTLPGATTTVAEPAFAPSAGGRSSRTVTVAVPTQAESGPSEVTLTATTASGGSVSQTATLRVERPRIGFGKLRRNRARGTAVLPIRVSDPGTLKVFGRRLVRAQRKPGSARLLRVVVRARGRAKRRLNRRGTVRVLARVRLQPQGGAAVARSKAIRLVKRR